MQFQTSAPTFGVSALSGGYDMGDLGAPRRRGGISGSRKRKPAVSDSQRKKILAKFKWLRDEDRQLSFAFEKKMPQQAKAVFRKLARMRDRFRKQAMAAVEGKAAGQVAGRVAVGYYTLGVSELARLALKKPIAKSRKKTAVKILAKADACDMLLRFWKGKFEARVNALRKKAQKDSRFAAEFNAAAAAAKAGADVEADGAAVNMAPEPGDMEIESTMAASVEPGEVQVEAEESESADTAGFMGLSGKEVLGYGALGVLAGLFI